MTYPKRKQAILEETPTKITHGKQWNCWTGRKQLTASGCLLSNTSSNASIERLKARLMGKGYTQTCGLDFQKTFVLVTKMNTIRVLPSLVAKLDWCNSLMRKMHFSMAIWKKCTLILLLVSKRIKRKGLQIETKNNNYRSSNCPRLDLRGSPSLYSNSEIAKAKEIIHSSSSSYLRKRSSHSQSR